MATNSNNLARAATTAPGRRAVKERQGKVVENARRTLLMKGKKSSVIVNEVLSDLAQLKKPHAVTFRRTNDVLPFEDDQPMSFLCQKNDCSLFVLGSHSKKRPNNIIFGRTFEFQILDMYEFGVVGYDPIVNYAEVPKSTLGSKPVLIFQGDLFEVHEEFQALRNFFVDFLRLEEVTGLLLQGVDHALVISALDEQTIALGHYRIDFKKSGTRLPRVELEAQGPMLKLRRRRQYNAASDLRRIAMKKPRETRKKKTKNVRTDIMGDKYGRIHLGKQDLNAIATRKMKGLKRTAGARNGSGSGSGSGGPVATSTDDAAGGAASSGQERPAKRRKRRRRRNQANQADN